MNVFFYGLFMDEQLLAGKGIAPSSVEPGFLSGHALVMGERATLVPRPDSRAYGVVMNVARDDVDRLYAERSVADYVAEPVLVELMDGRSKEARCYKLPAGKVTGTNREYAASLLEVATSLGFPDTYLDEIRRAHS